MKFDKQFQAKMVPEMKQHYLDYKILVEQIRLVRKAAFTLGSAFADLNGALIFVRLVYLTGCEAWMEGKGWRCIVKLT